MPMRRWPTGYLVAIFYSVAQRHSALRWCHSPFNELAVVRPNSVIQPASHPRRRLSTAHWFTPTSWDQMAWIDLNAYVYQHRHQRAQVIRHQAADDSACATAAPVIGKPVQIRHPDRPARQNVFVDTSLGRACWTDPMNTGRTPLRCLCRRRCDGIDASDLVVPKSAPLWTEIIPPDFSTAGFVGEMERHRLVGDTKQIELTPSLRYLPTTVLARAVITDTRPRRVQVVMREFLRRQFGLCGRRHTHPR